MITRSALENGVLLKTIDVARPACAIGVLNLLQALLMAWTPSPALAERAGMIVPAYQYPTLGTMWADCARASSRVPLVAILDPANGPGSGVDPNYTSAVASVRAAGGRVIGYLDVASAGIPLDSVLTLVDRYRAWYVLDGVFLDRMASDSNPAHVAWHTALRDSIRAREPAWLVVGSPGTNTLPEYLSGADILCIFESDGATYFNWEPNAWVRDYPPSRWLHLVYSVSTADSMQRAVARAATLGAGWVYVTDDRLPNPWDAPPTYWEGLITAVETSPVSVEAPVERSTRLRAWPNPARGAVRFEWPGPGSLEIEILDVSGRVVARVAGASPLWNGSDQSGRQVPNGIYLARVRGRRNEPVHIALVR